MVYARLEDTKYSVQFGVWGSYFKASIYSMKHALIDLPVCSMYTFFQLPQEVLYFPHLSKSDKRSLIVGSWVLNVDLFAVLKANYAEKRTLIEKSKTHLFPSNINVCKINSLFGEQGLSKHNPCSYHQYVFLMIV